MKLNNLNLIQYDLNPEGTVTFIVDDTKTNCLSLDGRVLRVTSGDSDVAVFSGYHVTGVVDYESSTGNTYTKLTAARSLDPETAQTISGLEQNLSITQGNITTLQDTSKSQAELIDANASAIAELSSTVFATTKTE